MSRTDCFRPLLPLLTVALAASLLGCAPAPPVPVTPVEADAAAGFLLAEADIPTLQAHMARGELDSAAITAQYLQRIAASNRSGPQLRAVLETNPAAQHEAATRDEERRQGISRGPLHGIPVLLNDTIAAAPLATSAGALPLQDFRPDDAYLVKRLRHAGAVVLGKGNMSEWDGHQDPPAAPGWSARGGQTRNPYGLRHSPCGTSSGAAVAVAANLTSVAIGTGSQGGLLCPAAVNGIVGLKPTVGLVSRDGVLAASYSQDSPGPMARTVSDVAIVLTAIAGRDDADPATAAMPGRAVYDYTARLRDDGLRNARIGVLDSPLAAQPGVEVLLRHAVAELRGGGATVIRVPDLDSSAWAEDEQTVLRHEVNAGLARYLGTAQAPLRSLDEVLAWYQHHPDGPDGQRWLALAAQAGPLGSAEYLAARSRARRMAGEQGIDALLKAHKLDALVAPTAGPAPLLQKVNAARGVPGSFAAATAAGYPALTVPMGQVDGLPVGLLFTGTAWSEPRLVELGYAFEQRTLARRPPRLVLPGGAGNPER